jgi:hypothetical protein
VNRSAAAGLLGHQTFDMPSRAQSERINAFYGHMIKSSSYWFCDQRSLYRRHNRLVSY